MSKQEEFMNPYRFARNQTLVALSAADEITHLVTEAALESEVGATVDKAALIAALKAQQTMVLTQVAAAIATIQSIPLPTRAV